MAKPLKSTGKSLSKTEKPSPMTEQEKSAAKAEEQVVSENGADTQRLSLVTNLVSEKFNLDPSYRVIQFKDTNKVVALTLENSDFIVSVTVKDSERQGIFVEQ